MMIWNKLDPGVDLGFLPELISDRDPRPAAKQLDETYAHGGGWDPLPGFKLGPNYSLKYPGDPPLRPLAMAKLRDEKLVFYHHSYLAVFQPDGSFEVSRVD